MLEQSKFLVSFDCQNEKFCEELIITYRTEELRPYLIFPRVKPNPNYYTDSGATFNKHLRTPKQIKTEKEMKTLLLIPVIPYTWLSLTHRDKIYHQIPNPTNKQKYIYLILQGLQIIPVIPLETLILRIPNY